MPISHSLQTFSTKSNRRIIGGVLCHKIGAIKFMVSKSIGIDDSNLMEKVFFIFIY